MSILHNFPMIPERTPITADGHPSENSGLNCVPTSLLAGVMWLKGISQLGGIYTPDSFKDAVYGQGITGGEAASAYVGYLKTLGINLFSQSGSPAQLVEAAHRHIQAGHPVVFTEPNPYGNPNFTHVCVFFGEAAGSLTSMDPWIAQSITHSDTVWEQTLLDNEIWILELENMKIDIKTPSVADYFTLQADGSWLCKHPGFDGKQKTIAHGMLSFYQSFGGVALCGLTFLGLPVSNEIPLQGVAVRQHFERGVLFYDPQHQLDRPPGSGDVYLAHLYGGPGQDPRVATLTAQVNALTAQLAQPTTVPADVQQKLDHDEEILKQVRLLVS